MAMADLSASGETDVSLIALTSHFAQVQFRLKQITSSPADKREGLLHQLEEYAFQGCPVKLSYDSNTELSSTPEHKQFNQILNNLQSQLSELTTVPPTSPTSFDKQTIVLDELSKRFDVQFEDLEMLSEDEVRVKVNEVLTQKQRTPQKDNTVRQLISQVRSMEEHITQLQSELAATAVIYTNNNDNTDNTIPQYNVMWSQDNTDDILSLHRVSSVESLISPLITSGRSHRSNNNNNKGIDSLQRTLALMKILTLWGCGGTVQSKPTNTINEYPKAVRMLELIVDKILLITTALSEPGLQQSISAQLESELFEAVSMVLSDTLQELLEHGWIGQLQSTPTSCIPPLQWIGGVSYKVDSEDCLAWKTVQYYYHRKKGPKLCDKPELKLSSSFRLPVDSTLKPKQTLLSSIHYTEKCFTMCRNYKNDLKFRSFVCQGFNLHHLHDWIRIIINCPSLIDDLYQQSSFMSITKFRPVLQVLERLTTAPIVSSVTLPSTYFHHVNN